jgi:hypothetical protein
MYQRLFKDVLETRKMWTMEYYGDLEEDYQDIIEFILDDHKYAEDIHTIMLHCDGETPHCDVWVEWVVDAEDRTWTVGGLEAGVRKQLQQERKWSPTAENMSEFIKHVNRILMKQRGSE